MSSEPAEKIENTSRGSLAVVFLTVFIDLLGFGIVLPLLPIYADQFGVDEHGVTLGLLMASFSAMQFLFAPFWGRLSDRIGRRPVIMIGLLGSVIFYAIFGIATVEKCVWLLFVSRIGAGIAGATISTAQAYIADTTSLENRPKGMALIGMAFGLGFTFGPLVGFLAVPTGEGDPGPWPGYVAAILSAGALALAWFKLPESLPKEAAANQSNSHRGFSLGSLGSALKTKSIGGLLIAFFVCVFSFANFETTLGLMISGSHLPDSPFHFSFGAVCLTFAFIGFTLAIVQGGIVRRLAGRISEGTLAAGGGVAQIVGFLLIAGSVHSGSVPMLYFSLAIIVSGFAFVTPSLNSLLSRRTDPEKQGGILGLAQSVNSMARIIGSGLGIPLLKIAMTLPAYVAAALMAVGVVLVIAAARSGKDYAVETADAEST
ncbi:MFS transporter [Blastopirellula marina]|uniref:MFS transporter n=1 Tax=Blastopirellula marina TaxID=124 RepID=A0A2S8FWA0_9BACT|nr:MFS transporter [Blastopirellula marina]PQO36433.1 MFS transporter [Blastopirellula marina]PTL44270.1 MFS transporter [Blastopirellula marina]